MDNMITFEKGDSQFTYRAAGALLHEERVLLHRARQDDFWALPGGRVEFHEASSESLRREIQEEINTEVQVERLLWVVENFFEHRGKKHHELGIYYLLSLPPGSPLHRRDEFTGKEDHCAAKPIELIFRWFDLDMLNSVSLYPSFLREALQNLPVTAAHIVHTDTE